jgi:DNA-binding MarR family transcriptional regulator
MKEKESLDLTHELFQLMKQFPNLKLKQSAIIDLTRSEYELLVILKMNVDDQKTAISVSEISNLLQITPAGVTHLINPLEEKGFVKRLPAPNDRRIVLIGFTNKGTKTAEAIIADVQREFIGLVNYLGEEDSRTLVRLMSRALEYFASQFEN